MRRRLLALLLLTACMVAVVAACRVDGPAREEALIENVRTFAKLYGYVRYFHPSDAASAIDWERFAVHGVRQVKDADGQGALRETLEALFLPIAPTVQIYRAGDSAPPPAGVLTPGDTSGMKLVVWQHRGVGLGNKGPYRSIRLNRMKAQVPEPTEASFWQRIDAVPYRGRAIHLQAALKTDVSGNGNHAQLVLYTELPNLEFDFSDYMQDRPVSTTEWETYEITGTVGDGVDTIGVAGMLVGPGKAWFDNVQLRVRAENEDGWTRIPLENAGFEFDSTGEPPAGWGAAGQGYRFWADTAEAYDGERSLAVEYEDDPEFAPPLFEARPEPGEVVERPIGSGLYAQIPLALYSSGGQTLRPEDAPSLGSLEAELQAIVTSELTFADQALRHADVIISWNVLQHFYPYFDVVDVDWDAVLAATLQDALDDSDAEDFVRSLKRMVACLEDGHGSVDHPVMRDYASLPFLPDLVEGHLVVVATDVFSPVEVGDIVLSVDSVSALDYLAKQMELHSGSEQWRRWSAMRRFGLGLKGDTVSVSLLRDEEEVQLKMRRNTLGYIAEVSPPNITEIAPRIFYVNLSRADAGEINARMDELSAADGVIFDLRGYPNSGSAVLRHLTDRTLTSASWDWPQIIYPDSDHMDFDTTAHWNLTPMEPRITGAVVFLTNERAISQAESIMEIVEHYQLGEIIGRSTAGTNGDINRIVLPGGATVTFTGARVRKQDGSQLHLVGIQPTIPLERTLEAVQEGRDEYIEKAIEIVRSKNRE